MRCGTFKIFLQLFFPFNFSQINSLILCHFSLNSSIFLTNCRLHLQFHEATQWELANSPPMLPAQGSIVTHPALFLLFYLIIYACTGGWLHP